MAMAMAMAEWRPHKGPQTLFFTCPAFELLYGGASGGGKTECMVVDATRQVEKKGYNAILFRRTFPELETADGLISRSREFYPALGGLYNETRHVWTFPKGSTIRFGHIATRKDFQKYQGSQFQFIGFDELISFEEYMYRFLFRSCRTKEGSGIDCTVRDATNPDDNWVKTRWAPWVDPEHPRPALPGEIRYFAQEKGEENEIEIEESEALEKIKLWTPGAKFAKPWSRSFIPSSYRDNPSIDPDYEAKLDLLPLVERQRQKYGDWTIVPGKGKVFNRKWLSPNIVNKFPDGIAKYFRVWDLAATEKRSIGHDPDYTATALGGFLGNDFYLQITRARKSWGNVESWILETIRSEPDITVGIEQEPGATGKAVIFQIQKAAGRKIRAMPPRGDKVMRANPLAAKAEIGQVYLVTSPGTPINETLSEFHGFPEVKHDDQVDAGSGCFKLASGPRVPLNRRYR